MNKRDLKLYIKNSNIRKKYIELTQAAGKEKRNQSVEEEKQNQKWQQNNETPMEIVDKMISKTDITNKIILVLFNLEFLERLIYKYKVPAENIFFFADTALEEYVAKKLYKVTTTLGSFKIMNETGALLKRILEMGQKKFDLLLSNPTFNGGMDLKILKAIKSICKEMIIVHPATWLLDMKNKHKLFGNFKTTIKGKLKSVELFNGNSVFGINLFGPCVITHVDDYTCCRIKVNSFGTEYESDTVEDITKFEKEWIPTVKPFMARIKKYISENSNIWQHHKLKINSDKFYCQFPAIRGNVNKIKGSNVVKDDFYTMVMKNSDKNKNIKYSNFKRMSTFEFNTEIERDNFIRYCKTDFARFCLSLHKSGPDLPSNNITLIPWMDFTQEWDDKKLYEFFNINEETQKYIEEFLPDYYSIRKN